jgi:hypothetical protein
VSGRSAAASITAKPEVSTSKAFPSKIWNLMFLIDGWDNFPNAYPTNDESFFHISMFISKPDLSKEFNAVSGKIMKSALPNSLLSSRMKPQQFFVTNEAKAVFPHE